MFRLFLPLALQELEGSEDEDAGGLEELEELTGLLELGGGACTDELEMILEVTGRGVGLPPEFEPEPVPKISF